LAREPLKHEGAFVAVDAAEVDEILCLESVRKVGKDNVVTIDGVALQIARQPGRATCDGASVIVRRYLSGQLHAPGNQGARSL
jgi:hypothetical protein